MNELAYALQKEILNPTNFLQADKPFPVSATPFILDEPTYSTLTGHARNVYTAIEKVTRAYLADEEIQNLFPEYESVRTLSKLAPNTGTLLNLARFDFAVLKDGAFKMMETNTSCPGALTTVGLINNAFVEAGASLHKDLEYRVPLTVDDRAYFIRYLEALVKKAHPDKSHITMAFVSSEHRRIVTDLNKLTELAREFGFHAIRCEVQDLVYDGERLSHDGVPIDGAFLKFDSVIDETGECDLGIYGKDVDSPESPLMRAMRDEAFVYVNTLPSMLISESKRMLALLFDPNVRIWLTEEECKSIDAIVAKTSYLGQKRRCAWDLDEISKHKDKFVIKSVNDTRGRGVFLGRYTSQNDWDSLIARCTHGRHVVQEFLNLEQQSVEKPIGQSGYFNAYTDIGLYQLGGASIGFLCRASSKPIVNVGNGGALRPTFVIRR